MMPMITAFSVNMICSGASIEPSPISGVERTLGAEQRHPAGGAHGIADEQRQAPPASTARCL
jgi:hypothetical protein